MIFKDKGILKAMWAGMFILCALLGFVPSPQGANKWLLLVFGILFFVPPALLLWQCKVTGYRKDLILIRNLSIISLAATLVLLIVNMLSMLASEKMGDAVYFLLTIVSVPMICCQFWYVSLFLWASLLWTAILALKDIKK